MALQTITYEAIFDGISDGDLTLVEMHVVAEHLDGTKRTLTSAVPVYDPKLLDGARQAKPGDTLRVTEVTDWDDDDIPNWLTALEVVSARKPALSAA